MPKTREEKQAALAVIKAEQETRIRASIGANEAAVVAEFGQEMYDSFVAGNLGGKDRTDVLQFLASL